MAEIGANVAFSALSFLPQDLRLDPYLACNFVVEIEGLLVGGFSGCTGLEVETEVENYREGGVNDYVHCFVGATKHPLLELDHGLSPIDGLWSWHQDVVAGAIRRRNGTIYLLNPLRLPVMWWNFKEALPVKWTGPMLNAQESAVAFESLQIAHHGLSRPRFATAVSGIAGELINLGATMSGGNSVGRGVGGFF
jgi:phage tail-like protein